MLSIQSRITEKLRQSIAAMGGDEAAAEVSLSNRPELSEFQSAAAMRLAKPLKQPPLAIAESLAAAFDGDTDVMAEAVKPGFLNFRLTDGALHRELDRLNRDGHDIGAADGETIIVDYGGPNVAKPLHIGHLRAAIIGEAVKRIGRATGNKVIGDVHLGDWGLQMGQIIAELEDRHPDWPFFADGFSADDAPATPLFSSDELNRVYPAASARCKEDEAFLEKARAATAKLQSGAHAGYRALWETFVAVSIAAIRKDYDRLLVSFDYWYGESDAHPFLQPLIDRLTKEQVAVEDDGALIISVVEESDKKEIPPLMLVKSNGSVGYGATDLATLSQRRQDWNPDRVVYVVDKRQAEHFVQVFRASEKAGLFDVEALRHVGFGTMNGKDGKPFKTREGGIARLSDMIADARALTLSQTGFAEDELDRELNDMVEAIAIAAIKFGDLQNPYNTDYIFNPEEFVRFEGKTGPYIQYASVRARAIIEKAGMPSVSSLTADGLALEEAERALAVQLLAWPLWLKSARREWRPDLVCTYVYDLAKAFSVFYKHCPVAADGVSEEVRAGRLLLTHQTRETINFCLDLLAIPVPERMLRKDG